MTEIISELTPEQEALILVYREKWRKIALSTERIDREKAIEAVKTVYNVFGSQEPEFICIQSPDELLREIGSKLKTIDFLFRAKPPLGFRLFIELSEAIINQVKGEAKEVLFRQFSANTDLINTQINFSIEAQVKSQLENKYPFLVGNYHKIFSLISRVGLAARVDFAYAVLNCVPNEKKWAAFQDMVKYSGWINMLEKVCIICDRPIHLHFDNQNRLHAEGEAAIQFADGYSLYSYHGVTLPEKYGKIHPHSWESQWLLSEYNAELRRVLIQGIGYDRIACELQAIELDAWAEYTLLKIDADVDDEPIHLLKMTCPSTGFIHALRVPPDTQSAREAIRWINWGIDPEEFQQQT
jgi:hypothetical protein